MCYFTAHEHCIGKAYEDPHDDIETFKTLHTNIFNDMYRVLKVGGSVCWQIGYHISDKCVIPLDYLVYDLFTSLSKDLDFPLTLRNRIIWTFGHGLNSTNRFSGRHEVILWFTKGEQKIFNLDEVRVPQKYPGKKAYRGPNKGKLSGNPLGKNPSDVWEIPNVSAKHVEKTDHPCQFPIAIPKYDTGLQGHRIPVNSAVVPCSRYSQGSAGKYITRRLPFCGSRRIHFSRLL